MAGKLPNGGAGKTSTPVGLGLRSEIDVSQHGHENNEGCNDQHDGNCGLVGHVVGTFVLKMPLTSVCALILINESSAVASAFQ
jgi:hypothetical protein